MEERTSFLEVGNAKVLAMVVIGETLIHVQTEEKGMKK